MTKLLTLIPLIIGCSTKYLPSPATPARTLPELPIEPPPSAQGHGRIAFDVVDGPSRVEAILATETWNGTYVHGSAERTTHVCDTPCVVNMPYGTYKMRFALKDHSRSSEEEVVVGAEPSVYRYATGIDRSPTGPIVGTALLVVASMAAGGLAIGGYATGNTGLGHTGVALSIGFDIGAVLVFQKARIRQHGAVQQWTPTGEVYTRR